MLQYFIYFCTLHRVKLISFYKYTRMNIYNNNLVIFSHDIAGISDRGVAFVCCSFHIVGFYFV